MRTEHTPFLILTTPPKAKAVVVPPPEVKNSARDYSFSGYVNIKTYGVRNKLGEWVEFPWFSKWATLPAKNLKYTEALNVFETCADAYELVDGCDPWACLSDRAEVFVVRKQK